MSDLSSLSFRPAGLGGFNKKDVVTYVRTLSDKHTAEMKALSLALEEEKRANAALTTELEAAQGELNDLRAALEEARQRADHAEASLALANDTNRALTKSLTEAEAGRVSSDSRLQALEQEASNLRAEKQTNDAALGKLEKQKQAVAELEVEARLRAREAEDAARARIDAIISAYQSEFAEAKDSFVHYKTSASRLIASTEEQLAAMQQLFASLENELALSEKAFEKLSDDPAAL